ncbi:uncharacterized protein LOC125889180 [Xyrichtys novacula]|uniref:Uncharacterized protein LOC125889180 n=1 Tax=Xyrichtys novacula TaxID=13765 RepID=A0AAV1GTH1_XYRNO|nr:uncharacterized protein LOC125889180 [Xyrichtys novacula]
MNVEKEATLKAAERELHSDSLPDKRARKPKCLNFGDEDTSTGDKDSGSGNPKLKKAKGAAQRQAEEELLSEDGQFIPGPAESSSQESDDLTRDLQSQIKALQRENTKLRNMAVKEIPTLLVEMRKLVSINTTNNKDVHSCPTKDVDDPDAESDGPGEMSPCTPCTPSQVKIGNDGTVTISIHCWETAKACTSANGMAQVLLIGLFDVDVLLKSNLKGGVSKLDPMLSVGRLWTRGNSELMLL